MFVSTNAHSYYVKKKTNGDVDHGDKVLMRRSDIEKGGIIKYSGMPRKERACGCTLLGTICGPNEEVKVDISN
jgi:hypothetical protein